MRLDISSKRRVRALAIAAALSGLAAGAALAGPHGGGGPAMGGMSGTNGGFGGRSAGQISPMGLSRSNGPTAADRDFGRDRASDVRSGMAGRHSASASNGINGLDRDRGADRAADRAHRHGRGHRRHHHMPG